MQVLLSCLDPSVTHRHGMMFVAVYVISVMFVSVAVYISVMFVSVAAYISQCNDVCECSSICHQCNVCECSSIHHQCNDVCQYISSV